MSGRDHSIECTRCGAYYGGFDGPKECPCTGWRHLNKFECEYILEIEIALRERTDLTDAERHLLEMEIVHIREGVVQLTGPDTVEERLERLRNHFP
jgi:hypothetical protein